jgi:hypothetical protein
MGYSGCDRKCKPTVKFDYREKERNDSFATVAKKEPSNAIKPAVSPEFNHKRNLSEANAA